MDCCLVEPTSEPKVSEQSSARSHLSEESDEYAREYGSGSGSNSAISDRRQTKHRGKLENKRKLVAKGTRQVDTRFQSWTDGVG